MSFYERLKFLCKSRGITPTALCRILGLSTSKVTAWKNGSLPTAKVSLLIADHFDVPIDFLLDGRNTESSHNTITGNNNIIGNGNQVGAPLTEQERALLKLFGQMDVIKQAQLLSYAAELVK